MYRTLRTASLAALMGAVLLPAGELAADKKIFTGTVCKPQTASGWNNIVYSWDAALANVNFAGEGVLVVCPITRDNTTATTPVNVARIDAYNNGKELKCHLAIHDNNSTSGGALQKTTSAVGWTTLEWDAMIGGATDWTIFFYCTVPGIHPTHGSSFLKTIWVAEP
jgi:hypothetical protein